MEELTASANGIEIVYQTFGDAADPTILLIMGLGVQMLGWDERLCELLVERGFQVVRFDNRDVGRSTKLSEEPRANLVAALSGDLSSASYRLSDMAADSAGLLDHLAVEAAHVVGASQGGMIGQTMAIERPERVLSLTSIMSTTGDPSVGQPHPEAVPALLTRPPADREGFAESVVGAWRVIGSPGFDGDEDALRARARASFDRGIDPDGTGRQLVAILASGDRTEALRVGCADGSDPRHGRSADRCLGWEGHRRGDPGRGAGADRGDGPRPAAAAVAAFRRPDRGQRRAGASWGRPGGGGVAGRLNGGRGVAQGVAGCILRHASAIAIRCMIVGWVSSIRVAQPGEVGAARATRVKRRKRAFAAAGSWVA